MHIGFIMDGNRRWATAKNLAKHLGHHQGAVVAEKIMETCCNLAIEEVSFWALAKKNIEERSQEELTYLFGLIEDWIERIEKLCSENNVSFHWIGNPDIVPQNTKDIIQQVIDATKNNTGTRLIIGIGYGGQDEIVRATKKAMESGLTPSEINERTFLKFLDTGRFSPPDLIIRTGGDTRHSGYFLYQAEYSEYYFTKTLWPDFTNEELTMALEGFKGTKRNFGK